MLDLEKGNRKLIENNKGIALILSLIFLKR